MERLTIERLGDGGDGVAAGPIYVPGALPGEVVEGVVADGRMRDLRILEPSDQRVRAPCTHAKACGGCNLQHAHDDLVRDWKADRVVRALKFKGLEAPIRAVHTSLAQSRRRATFAGRRTKKGAFVGFHGRASGTVVSVPGCQVVEPGLRDCLPVLEALTIVGGSRKGEMSFALTATEAGADLLVTGGKPLDLALREAVVQATADGPVARVTWGDELVAQHRPARVRFGDVSADLPPGAFLQATVHGQEALISSVTEALTGKGPIVDLFAGAGTFSLPLAKTREVHSVEGEADLIEALGAAWRGAQGVRAVSTEVRDLFRNPLLPEDLTRFEGAVIDPPRAGAEAQTRAICGSNLGQIAAVSCNPVTFARDAALLVEAGFGIDWIDVVDQFRWSPHVELVARFSR